MIPRWIEALLSSRMTETAARAILTFPFWGSGLAKLLNFSGGMAEMSHFGLEPAWFYNSLTIFVQLTGSALIITNSLTWLGAGALGVFTFLTIPIVHAFWRFEGEEAVRAFHTAGEHIGMIGALVLVSVLALRPQPATASEDATFGLPLPNDRLLRR
ncbi:DoxX family protein [Microvirga sp. P5_D2]